MTVSRQDSSLTKTGRAKQKARTRAALLRAAVELVREGRGPSMPEAADRAMMSVASAYRYFPTAEALWFEASAEAVLVEPAVVAADGLIEAAGDDPADRLEVLIRTLGHRMLDDQTPFRRLAKAALEQWFNQVETGGDDAHPVREGRRNHLIAVVVAPLRTQLPDEDVDRLAHALGVIVGTDAMLALTDGVGLSVPQAKHAMLDAGRWLITGALAELHDPTHTQ